MAVADVAAIDRQRPNMVCRGVVAAGEPTTSSSALGTARTALPGPSTGDDEQEGWHGPLTSKANSIDSVQICSKINPLG
jgi:hypothetical protein